MKTILKETSSIKTKWPGVFVDSKLDKEYKGKTVFSKKLNAVNESLKKPGFPVIANLQK